MRSVSTTHAKKIWKIGNNHFRQGQVLVICAALAQQRSYPARMRQMHMKPP
jgi:hypothetical protein